MYADRAIRAGSLQDARRSQTLFYRLTRKKKKEGENKKYVLVSVKRRSRRAVEITRGIETSTPEVRAVRQIKKRRPSGSYT